MKLFHIPLVKFLCFLAVFYFIMLVSGCAFQNKLLFFPTPLPAGYTYRLSNGSEEVFIKTSDSIRINAIHFHGQQNNDKVVLYFHGNAGSLDSWQYVAPEITGLGCDLLLIDYRGYGKNAGKFSEEGFYKDAASAYNYLLAKGYKKENILIYGRSLGTGIAVNLAMNVNAGALILETPYYSMSALATEKYPWLLPSLYIRYKFNSLSKVPKLTIPVLLIHGDSDELIPYRHSQKLYDAIQSKKKLVLIKTGQHNNLSSFPEHRVALAEFVNSY